MHCWSWVWILAWRLIYLAFVLKYDVHMYIKNCHEIKHVLNALIIFVSVHEVLISFYLGKLSPWAMLFFSLSLWLWKQDKVRLLQQLDRNIYKPSVDKFSFSTVKHCVCLEDMGKYFHWCFHICTDTGTAVARILFISLLFKLLKQSTKQKTKKEKKFTVTKNEKENCVETEGVVKIKTKRKTFVHEDYIWDFPSAL